MGDVRASAIASFLETSLHGEDIVIQGVSSLDALESYTLGFSKSIHLRIDLKALLLVPWDFTTEEQIFSYIRVENPRLVFAKVLEHFFVDKIVYERDSTSIIGDNCTIAKEVKIAKYCVIGDNVSIGKGSVINNHVVIGNNTIIGEKCYIKSGSIIGEEGFGFDFEDDGRPVRIPHIGNVVIGDEVEIGAKNTIARATLGSTKIADNVKIDDQVHIAHNCSIGKNTIITACVEISGSVHIGEKCWIAPNVSIIQKVSIGDNVTIGIGAVVTKEIEDNKKIMGLEGLELRPLMKLKRRIDYGK